MAMGSTFEDRSDLFAPPYIPGDPASERANREWQARNRNMTYDLVDELRMPRFGDTRTIAEMNVNPFAVSNANDGDPRGDVDPLALVALAQGGPYDIDARRAAIQARRDAIAKLLTDQQVAQQLAQAAPTDTASRELTSGLGQGIQAGDMAVSGATPGSVTQQGFFSTAVPNEPDPNNVFSAPPPAPSKSALDEEDPDTTPTLTPDNVPTPTARPAEAPVAPPAAPVTPSYATPVPTTSFTRTTPEGVPTSSKTPGARSSDFDEDAANQAVADMIAEAIANSTPTAPATPETSSHNRGGVVDVVSPTTTAPTSTSTATMTPGNKGSTADVISPGDAGKSAGRGGMYSSEPDTTMGKVNDAIVDFFGGDRAAVPGSPPDFAAVAPDALADARSSPVADNTMTGGRSAYSGTPTSPVADNTMTGGRTTPSGFTVGGRADLPGGRASVADNMVAGPKDQSQVGTPTPSSSKAATDTDDTGRDAITDALSMASLVSMGMPAAPGMPASDYGDFATGKSMDGAVAAAAGNTPGASGPVGPGGMGGIGGPSVGGFSATGGFGTSPGGPGMGMSEGAMAAAAAAAAAANGDISLGDFSGGDYGGITDAASPGGYDTQGTTDLGDLGGGTGGITDAASPGGDQGPSPGGDQGPSPDGGGMGEGSGASGPGGDTAW